MSEKDRVRIIRSVLTAIADQMHTISFESNYSCRSIAIVASILILREGQRFGPRWSDDADYAFQNLRSGLRSKETRLYIHALICGVVEVDRSIMQKFPVHFNSPAGACIISPTWLAGKFQEIKNAAAQLGCDEADQGEAALMGLLFSTMAILKVELSRALPLAKVPTKVKGKAAKPAAITSKANPIEEVAPEAGRSRPLPASKPKASTKKKEGKGKQREQAANEGVVQEGTTTSHDGQNEKAKATAPEELPVRRNSRKTGLRQATLKMDGCQASKDEARESGPATNQNGSTPLDIPKDQGRDARIFERRSPSVEYIQDKASETRPEERRSTSVDCIEETPDLAPFAGTPLLDEDEMLLPAHALAEPSSAQGQSAGPSTASPMPVSLYDCLHEPTRSS